MQADKDNFIVYVDVVSIPDGGEGVMQGIVFVFVDRSSNVSIPDGGEGVMQASR